MDLLKLEIQKLFFNKRFLIIFLLFSFVPAILNIVGSIDFKKGISSSTEIYTLSKAYEGKINNEMLLETEEEIKKLIKMKDENPEQYKIIDVAQENLYYSYSDFGKNVSAYNGENKTDSLLGIKELEKSLHALKVDGKENTYEYKNMSKQYNMMVSSGEPEFNYNIKTWSTFYGFTGGGSFLFLTLLITLVLSPIFSNEYSSGMDSIIFSSKNGRKKIVQLKFLSAVICTFFMVVIYNIIQLGAIMLSYGVAGWEVPIKSYRSFVFSPYSLNMLQLFGMHLFLQILGSLIFALIIVMVSSLSKTSLAAFFTSICLIFYPSLLGGILKINENWTWVRPFIDLSISQIINANKLFASYKSYNIFGEPILYPFISVSLILMIAIIPLLVTRTNIIKRDAY